MEEIRYTGMGQVVRIYSIKLHEVWCRHQVHCRNDVAVNAVSASHCKGVGCAAFRLFSANKDKPNIDYIGYCGAELMPPGSIG